MFSQPHKHCYLSNTAMTTTPLCFKCLCPSRVSINPIPSPSTISSPARRCPPVPSIPNGYVFEGTRFPGSRTLFSCFPSHVIEGARFIACQNNWTYDKPLPRCGECMHANMHLHMQCVCMHANMDLRMW